MLEELKKEVYEANMLLPKYSLVTFTWGNVSGIDESGKYFVIKPSGIEYDRLTPEDMVVMDLDGNRVEGRYNPSSDTKTHLILYQNFKDIGGVVHTHCTGRSGYCLYGNHTMWLFLWWYSMYKASHERRAGWGLWAEYR